MKFQVLQENLAHALSFLSQVIDNKPTMPILANVLIEAESDRISLSGINISIGFSMRIWVTARVDIEGSTTLPYKTLNDLVSRLSPERVDFNLDTEREAVKIVCGGAKSEILGITANDYPEMPKFEHSDMTIPAETLKRMISQTAYATQSDGSRPVLTGIHCLFESGCLTMAAADGYRLSVAQGALSAEFSEPVEMIVPAKAMQSVARMLGKSEKTDVLVHTWQRPNNAFTRSIYEGEGIAFAVGGIEIFSQLLDGKFPDYRAIVPKRSGASAVIYREDLLRACERGRIFAVDSNDSINLISEPSLTQIKVRGQSAERGGVDTLIDCEIEGAILNFSCNVKFLIEYLKTVEAPKIMLYSQSPANPVLLFPFDNGVMDSYTHVIMPMSYAGKK